MTKVKAAGGDHWLVFNNSFINEISAESEFEKVSQNIKTSSYQEP